MDKWQWKNYNGLRYITIPDWEKMGAKVVFSSRQGGFSEGIFASLNMGLHVGDNNIKVIKNRSKLLGILNTNLDRVVCCEQVHGSEIAIVTNKELGLGAREYATAIKGTDAMVTNEPQVFLTTFYADCIPVFLFDPVKRAIGLAHSGWKGTVARIGAKTVKVMQQQFACNIENINVFIGPGIGKYCFEIDERLASKVKTQFKDFKDILIDTEKGFFWDLENTNRQILLEIGVKPDKIITTGLCTACHLDDFFSYRRDKGKTGRMAAIIGLSY